MLAGRQPLMLVDVSRAVGLLKQSDGPLLPTPSYRFLPPFRAVCR